MYYLNKLVWILVNPAVAGTLLLLFALLLSRRNLGRLLLAVSLLWFVFWSLPVTSVLLGSSLEAPYLVDGTIPSPDRYPAADAIVVLGGGMDVLKFSDGSYHAEMNSNADRVWMGARLFRAGKASKIVLTSKLVDQSTVPLLKDLGVDESCIEYHEEPRNTEEEARLLATNGVKRILLVTSAWHMRRAEQMFRCYAPELEIIPAPADWEYTCIRHHAEDQDDLRRYFAYLPDAEAFWRSSIAFKEWLGIFAYRFLR